MEKELKRLNEIPKIIRLDLTGCTTQWDYHERIRLAFDFPEWYGRNWDAFWDLLQSECDSDKVEILGESTLPEKLKHDIEIMHRVLEDNKKEHNNYGRKPFDFEIID